MSILCEFIPFGEASRWKGYTHGPMVLKHPTLHMDTTAHRAMQLDPTANRGAASARWTCFVGTFPIQHLAGSHGSKSRRHGNSALMADHQLWIAAYTGGL